MEQRKSSSSTPAGPKKFSKPSARQDKKAFDADERTASDKRRHRFTESCNSDRALGNPSHFYKEEFASRHLKESVEELANRTQELHLGDSSSCLQDVKFRDSSAQTEPSKAYDRLEKIKEWWYSENPPPKRVSGNCLEPVPPRRPPADRVEKAGRGRTSSPVPWQCRPGPLRSIYDFTPQHPSDRQTNSETMIRRLEETKDPIALEDIINWAEVARIEQKRMAQNSRHAEVPNRSPAYDEPGYRWGVPLCVYDYCPQDYIEEDGPPGHSSKRPDHAQVPNRGRGVPLCPTDHCKQSSSAPVGRWVHNLGSRTVERKKDGRGDRNKRSEVRCSGGCSNEIAGARREAVSRDGLRRKSAPKVHRNSRNPVYRKN